MRMTSNQSLACLGGFGLGLACMYLLDPTAGGRRRALVRDKAIRLAHKTADGSDALARDLRNRAAGAVAQVRGRFEDRPVDDSVLEARVRSALGRVTTHPSAINVFSDDGCVTLMGPVLAPEHEAICNAVSRVSGVCEVNDQTTLHETAGSVPALQGEGSLP